MNLRLLDQSTSPTLPVDLAAEGLVMLVDKPQGWTSFDVVNKVRGMLRHRLRLKKIKVGHAGTLDPMATGLLILCTGKYTTFIDQFQARDKTYSGTLTLGGTTATYDAEAPVEDHREWRHLEDGAIQSALHAFRGAILQRPPAYSAIRIQGQRAYDLARKGRDVALEARPVHIHVFDVDTHELPVIPFRVVCSKGTYIRSLAHDLGQSLGCGAWLSALRRDAIGDYQVRDALTLEDLRIWAGLAS